MKMYATAITAGIVLSLPIISCAMRYTRGKNILLIW